MTKDTKPEISIVELDDGTKMQVIENAPVDPTPSKANRELAAKIVGKAEVTEWPKGYDVDMIALIGVRHEANGTKKEVIDQATHKVAVMLEKGELVLADDWAANNLG